MVTDEDNRPIYGVEVFIRELSETGTLTDSSGRYLLNIPSGRKISVVYKYLGYQSDTLEVMLQPGQHIEASRKLRPGLIELQGVDVEDRLIRQQAGTIRVDVRNVSKIPTPIGGIESALIVQGLGVSSTNELSAAYSVRGGNYDENIIYVNDFEIYRPFLIRSGQNEGMSFINPDMVQSVEFSSGGFQARYGDKMSSVLDVKYKRPKKFGGSIMAGLLGVAASLETSSQDERFSCMVGFRQRSNQYLLRSLPIKGQYVPLFVDLQTFSTFKINKQNEIEWLVNYARNRFAFIPEELTTTFGAINQVYQLRMAFEGSENDRYQTFMNGLSWTTRVNPRLRVKWLASVYKTEEIEAYDIMGDYFLGEVESDFSKQQFGQIKYALGTGALHRFARNRLETLVASAEHRGSLLSGTHQWQWGMRYQREQIEDKLNEWNMLDSAGYSIPFFHDRDTSLTADRLLKSSFQLQSNRISGFVQDTWMLTDLLPLSITYGVRFSWWNINREWLVSPRVQFSYTPSSRHDVVIRAAAGLYQQPPFYREMRNLDGIVNLQLRAQKSVHVVAGTDVNFRLWNRSFKFISEVYYKYLYDQVPYEFDNVLIRYFGENRSIGYSTGIDLRLHGEFVEDADSYISLSVMSSKEDIKGDRYTAYFDSTGARVFPTERNGIIPADSQVVYPGMIPRPTDQRVKLALYFEDYIPRVKSLRVHVNLIVATGLPFGPPDNERYRDVLRIPPYRRLDIGFSALLFDYQKHEWKNPNSFLRHFQSIWVTAEIWNLLGVENTISYLWIKDIYNTVWAVPNVLTARRFNVRLVVRF